MVQEGRKRRRRRENIDEKKRVDNRQKAREGNGLKKAISQTSHLYIISILY